MHGCRVDLLRLPLLVQLLLGVHPCRAMCISASWKTTSFHIKFTSESDMRHLLREARARCQRQFSYQGKVCHLRHDLKTREERIRTSRLMAIAKVVQSALADSTKPPLNLVRWKVGHGSHEWQKNVHDPQVTRHRWRFLAGWLPRRYGIHTASEYDTGRGCRAVEGHPRGSLTTTPRPDISGAKARATLLVVEQRKLLATGDHIVGASMIWDIIALQEVQHNLPHVVRIATKSGHVTDFPQNWTQVSEHAISLHISTEDRAARGGKTYHALDPTAPRILPHRFCTAPRLGSAHRTRTSSAPHQLSNPFRQKSTPTRRRS